MNTTEESALSLPITTDHLRIARKFALEQPTTFKAESVLHNTLAVLAIADYLEMMGIATNIAESDCWNPVMRICANIADLKIDGVGTLECRPLVLGASQCYVPPEVWEDRIAYAIVQIEEDMKTANLLGMVSQVATETIAINRLAPIEKLCVTIAALQAASQTNSLANIRNWLQGVFEAGWQDLDDLFFEQQTQLAWRSPTSSQPIENGLRQTLIQLANSSEVLRAKILDLGTQLGSQSIALVVAISEDEPKTTVHLRIYPMTGLFLPVCLNLKVIDESDNIFVEVQARRSDNYLQFQFSGDRGEHFSIQLSLGEIMLTEEFII